MEIRAQAEDGCELFANVIGNGQVTVVFSAGIADRFAVHPLGEQPAQRHRVVLPDIRGVGRSLWADPERHGWSRYVDDLPVLLNEIGVDRAVVAGAGMGSTIALLAGLRQPVRSPVDGALRAQPDLGGAPHDVAFSPDGAEVWFSNWSSPRLTVVSASSRQVLATLDAGTEPHHFAFANGHVIASDHAGDAVVRIDRATRQITERVATGPAPHHVGVAGDAVLVAINGTGQLETVDRSGAVSSLDVGAGPHDVVVLPG